MDNKSSNIARTLPDEYKGHEFTPNKQIEETNPHTTDYAAVNSSNSEDKTIILQGCSRLPLTLTNITSEKSIAAATLETVIPADPFGEEHFT